MSTPTPVGRNVRALRKARKITIQAFANAMSVTYTQQRNYEMGRTRITEEYIRQAAKELGVHVQTLFCEGESNGKDAHH